MLNFTLIGLGAIAIIEFIIAIYIVYAAQLKYRTDNVYFRINLEGRLQYSIDKKHWNYICKYVKNVPYSVPVNGQNEGPAYVYVTDPIEIDLYINKYDTLDKVHTDQRTQLKLYKDALYILLGIDN